MSAGLKKMLARVAVCVFGLAGFLLIRGDVVANLSSRYERGVASPRIVQDYVRSASVRKLQIGAGHNSKDGWLNTDIEPAEGQAFLDASQRFPLADGSFHYIFSEHVIEHLEFEQGLTMLKESHRVLAPGGKIRIATPNLHKFIDLVRKSAAAPPDYIGRKLKFHNLPLTPEPETYLFNIEMRAWGHRFVYTPSLLRNRLEAAGFRDVKEFAVGASDDAALANLEGRADWTFKDVNAFETMVLQGTR